MKVVAKLIADCSKDDFEENKDNIIAEVQTICNKYPLYPIEKVCNGHCNCKKENESNTQELNNIEESFFKQQVRVGFENKKYILEKVFAQAKELNKDVLIELTVPSQKETEYIIVKNENLDYKLNYYKNNYTSDLKLERFNEIKVLDARIGNYKNI